MTDRSILMWPSYCESTDSSPKLASLLFCQVLTWFFLPPVSGAMSILCSLISCFPLQIIPLKRVIYGENNHPFSPVMCLGSGTRRSGYWSSFGWAHCWWDLQAPCLIHLLPGVEIYLCKVLIALTVCQWSKWKQTTTARFEIIALVMTNTKGSRATETVCYFVCHNIYNRCLETGSACTHL